MPVDKPPRVPYYPGEMVEPEFGGYLRFIAALLRHKILISSAVVVAACGAGVVVFLRPDVYEASVLLMPESDSVHDRSWQLKQAVGQLLPGSTVGGEAEGLCLDLLESNRLLDAVIERLPETSRVWGETHREDMRKRLLSSCTFEPTQAGLLRITARVADAQLSARLANTLAAELQELYRSVALERVRGELGFLKRRLAEAGGELAAAEEKLAEFQRTKKMIRPDESAAATFSALMSLESRIIEEEVRLDVLKSYASASHPQVRLQEERVKALKKGMVDIEQDGDQPGASYTPDQVLIPFERLPEVGLEGVRIERELRLRENLYLFLMERYESLKLAEARESSALMVIEQAEVPEMRSGPRRRLWVFLAALAGLVVGSSCALIAERLRAMGSTEEGRKMLEELKTSVWRGG